jgi:hypothetical protein
MEAYMTDLIAEGIFLLSVLGVIVVMLMVIWKERKKRKNETQSGSVKNFKKSSYETSRRLYLN